MATEEPWYALTTRQRIFFTGISVAALILLQTIALWTIDIALSAMTIQSYTTTTIQLTNGFFLKDPMQAYHMGLWLVIGTTFALVVLVLYTLTRTIKCDQP